jgi:hypothetical protein
MLNDKQLEAARGNHAFYVVVGMEMCEISFAHAFLESLWDARVVLYGVEHPAYSGYIEIDTSNIRDECSHGGMADDVTKGLLGKVAFNIPQSITGEMNTDVTIVHGIYKFSFKITKYERDYVHGYEPIEDPALADDVEKLGRLVQLKVTIVPPSERS